LVSSARQRRAPEPLRLSDAGHRLVKELRMADISTVEAANAWLFGFVEDYNGRFGRAAGNPKNLHRSLMIGAR
jgi:hypothetical protein